MDSEQEKSIYQQRLVIIELVFGNIRSLKRPDRFTVRGKQKVNAQWNLYCRVHNIGNMLRYSSMFALKTT
ncbi:hypothetical protein GF348_24295 [candidate division KSB3 bacterium]|nr:hypothetical protein [candidate division KSB3 bacterium]